MDAILLSRDEFRTAVFRRDGDSCVHCGAPAADAHHLIERRLFPDGGYYLDNGVSVCPACHLLAEQTLLSPEELRADAGITKVILPPHLLHDDVHDKWGNLVHPDGTRSPGELFGDSSVRKALTDGGVLGLFDYRVKQPRTFHVSWSEGATDDDRVLPDLSGFYEPDGVTPLEVVASTKIDGETTSMYRDGLHARSLDFTPHPSRNWVKTLWASIAADIPLGWRISGENLYAKHSIAYENLETYFFVFAIWNEQNVCLDYDTTCTWAELLGLTMAPLLYRGPFDEAEIKKLWTPAVADTQEGYVIRVTDSFPYGEYRRRVGKFVRPNHVATSRHWRHGPVVPNQLAPKS